MASERPYPPSLLDRLYRRLEALPGRGLWVFPLLAAGASAYLHAVLWTVHGVPVTGLEPAVLSVVFYGPYAFGAIAFLRQIGWSAFDGFHTALGLPDADVARRRYELLTIPRRRLAPLVGVGVLLTIVAGSSNVAELERAGWSEPVAVPVIAVLLLLGYTGLPVAAYYAIRVLRGVARLHAEVPAIDPFRPGPLFALSRLTMWVGLAFVFNAYVIVTLSGSWLEAGGVELVLAALGLAFGVACFVLPLVGLHDRLVAEKDRLLDEVDVRLAAVRAEVHARVDGRAYPGMVELTETIGALGASRALVEGLPTWPWPPQLLRGFVSAIVLPLVVFVATEGLGRLLAS